jgi:hypothetical protein
MVTTESGRAHNACLISSNCCWKKTWNPPMKTTTRLSLSVTLIKITCGSIILLLLFYIIFLPNFTKGRQASLLGNELKVKLTVSQLSGISRNGDGTLQYSSGNPHAQPFHTARLENWRIVEVDGKPWSAHVPASK